MTSYDSNKEKFFALAKALVIYFPDYELVTPEGHWNCYFENKSDRSKAFTLSPDNNKGKFTVSERIIGKPDHRFDIYIGNDKLNRPEVGFSIDRPAEKIADGIKKRFMPEFEVYFKLWTEKWNKIESAKNTKEAVIKEFALLLGGVDTVNHAHGGIKENLSAYYSPHKNVKDYIREVYVSSPDSIEIKTNYLTEAQARKLIEFIKGL